MADECCEGKGCGLDKRERQLQVVNWSDHRQWNRKVIMGSRFLAASHDPPHRKLPAGKMQLTKASFCSNNAISNICRKQQPDYFYLS